LKVMVETLEDLKRQFKEMMAYEKAMLEKALRVTITEIVREKPLDEEMIVRKALGRRFRKRR